MFLGHFKFPKRIHISHDMKSVYTIGDNNGIFKWIFHGDQKMPNDIGAICEELPSEKLRK